MRRRSYQEAVQFSSCLRLTSERLEVSDPQIDDFANPVVAIKLVKPPAKNTAFS